MVHAGAGNFSGAVGAGGGERGAEWAAPRGAIRVVCLALLLAPWTVDAARILVQGWETALTPVPTCLTELHIAHGMQQVAEGAALYPVVDGLPYTFHLYQPLTYLPAGWAAGWLDGDFDWLLIAGRVLPFGSMFGLLLVLAYDAYRQTGQRWAAVTCVLMVLFYHSSTLTDFFRNRPETPALLMTIGGWVVVQRRPRGWPYLAAILFVAGLAFKPTFLAAPVACGVQLWWQGQRRGLAQLTASCLLLSGGVVAGSYGWLGQGYFQHTVGAMQACPMNPLAAAQHFFPILIHGHWGMLFPATLVAAGWLAVQGRARPLLLYLVLCLLATCLAQGKQGADLHYHAELSLLMVLTVVVGLGDMFRVRTVLAWAPLLLLLAGTWMPLFQFGVGWNQLSHQRIVRPPFAYPGPPVSAAEGQAERYREWRGEALILSDELAVRVGQPVVYDWYALQILFDVGHLDFDPLREAVQQRRYAVIVCPAGAEDRWSRAVQEAALASGYRRSTTPAGLVEFWR